MPDPQLLACNHPSNDVVQLTTVILRSAERDEGPLMVPRRAALTLISSCYFHAPFRFSEVD
jgi:hypothetical protein